MTTESKPAPETGEAHVAALKIEGKIEMQADDEMRHELLVAAARKYGVQLLEILRKAKDSDGDGIPEMVLQGVGMGAALGFLAGAQYGARTFQRSQQKELGGLLDKLLTEAKQHADCEPGKCQHEGEGSGSTKH